MARGGGMGRGGGMAQGGMASTHTDYKNVVDLGNT